MHAQSYLINRAQKPNEILQEYVHLFAELAKTITGTDARHNTENLYVTLFNRHLYNSHIKNHVLIVQVYQRVLNHHLVNHQSLSY